jgi:anti-sigma regulatory factor (Ser/Thr protein kinase)
VTSVQAPDWRYRHDEPRPLNSVPPAGLGGCRITLAPVPESTKTARDFTTATLRGWHLNALIQDAVMVASELVTNAIRHGTPLAVDNEEQPRVELTWWCQASGLICVVTDRSTQPPVLAPASLHAESGRGLQIVHALADTWGWTTLSTREKAVWATLGLPGTGRCADD